MLTWQNYRTTCLSPTSTRSKMPHCLHLNVSTKNTCRRMKCHSSIRNVRLGIRHVFERMAACLARSRQIPDRKLERSRCWQRMWQRLRERPTSMADADHAQLRSNDSSFMKMANSFTNYARSGRNSKNTCSSSKSAHLTRETTDFCVYILTRLPRWFHGRKPNSS